MKNEGNRMKYLSSVLKGILNTNVRAIKQNKNIM